MNNNYLHVIDDIAYELKRKYGKEALWEFIFEDEDNVRQVNVLGYNFNIKDEKDYIAFDISEKQIKRRIENENN